MWWSILLSLSLALLKWLMSDEGPLKQADEIKLREFFAVADKARKRAQARGIVL